MKLSYPLSQVNISQKFGEHKTNSDLAIGHTGVDFECAYGEPIKSCSTGVVVTVEQQNDLKYQRVVSVLTEDYVITYNHLSDILVREGQTVLQGDVIGKTGNSGNCFHDGRPITEDERAQHLYPHLHLEVKRISMVKNSNKQCIRNGKLKDVKIGKFKLEIQDYTNGYNGCIDPMQFFPPLKATDISSKGLELIATFEGFSLKPYQDIVGVWTIGYGSTYDLNGKKVSKDTKPITREQALLLLKQSVEKVCNFINTNIKASLSQNQYDAICSLGYNIGTGNLDKSNLVKNLNNGNMVVPDNFLSWNRAGGKFIQGLYKRRLKEWELYAS